MPTTLASLPLGRRPDPFDNPDWLEVPQRAGVSSVFADDSRGPRVEQDRPRASKPDRRHGHERAVFAKPADV